MTEFYIKVRPDSDSFQIEEDSITRIKLENRAENGRANREVVRILEDILGEKPGIVSGHKSSRKKLKVDLEKHKIDEKLEEAVKNR